MKVAILVMSCDAYSDLWQPFFKLKDKYWSDCQYEVYIGSETKTCKYAKTIKTQGIWTRRLNETLKQIDSDYIIFMLEDYFIREQVNQEQIDFCINNFDEKTASFDFQNVLADQHMWFDKTKKKGKFALRRNNQIYLTNTQPSIWNRQKFIKLTNKDMTIWEWETQMLNSPYKHYINRGHNIIDTGYYKDRKPWGIVQGKWSKEVIKMFEKEGIKMDLKKREHLEIDLSIIIPYYHKYDKTKRLFDVLIPQLNDRTEVILIDDGCDEKRFDNLPIKVIHQENGGVSKARNTGLDNKRGRYVLFVDAGDLVKPNYVKKWLDKIDAGDFDYGFHSWEYQDGRAIIIKDQPPIANTSVWNCCYNSNAIGKTRFNEQLQIGEDTEFNAKVRKGKKVNIEDVLYRYDTDDIDSLTHQFSRKEITEVRPVKSQIIIYRSYISLLGGVETAIYNACNMLKDKYDIMVLYDTCDATQLLRLRKLVKCVKFQGQKFECDTFMYYSLNPTIIESNITAKEFIQMICCDIVELNQPFVKSPKITKLVADSKATADAYMSRFPKDKCEVLHNLFAIPEPKKVLSIMVASRLSHEKGYDRLKALAKRMIEKGCLFNIEVFTNDLPNEEIDGFTFRKPRLNVTDYMWNKDYIWQLSNSESWGCTITEALERGIPVVCTDYKSAKEQVEDGVNGFILKRDLSNMDEVIDKMYDNNLKGFKYHKKDSVEEWENIFGKHKKSNYVYKEDEIETIIPELPANTFIALARMKDEEGNIKKEGEEIVLRNSTRIKLLFDRNLIKRVEE